MVEKRHCPKCSWEFDTTYQFCPFDRSPLGRKCPACGKIWELNYQFCPADSTALVAAPSTPAPPPAAPPQPNVPEPAGQPVASQGATLTFIEEAAKSSWKSALFRPVTIIFTLGTLLVISTAAYLAWRTAEPDLPLPAISYSLLPNEGKGKGVPVVIKVNHLAVFLIDDPMDAGSAGRAQQFVNVLSDVLQKAKGQAEVRFAVENVEGRPAILEVTQSGPQTRTLATVTDGDVALSGETDPQRVAVRWAERLTDAVKVYVLAQPPTFSLGTEFGSALASMYRSAAQAGKLTRRSLEHAYQQLSDAQRKALETPPRASHAS